MNNRPDASPQIYKNGRAKSREELGLSVSPACYVAPWRTGILAGWAICGMNHYHINGGKRLFVSMTRQGKCITEEGKDNEQLWERLLDQAKAT